MKDLVSVVIPYYNNDDTIIRALESVKYQTYRTLEVILVNDGSTDESYKLVEEYLENTDLEFSIKNIYQDNLGPSIARNKGVLLSKGNFIAFLDADDTWEDNKIENQVNLLKENEYIDMLGCNFYINNREEKIKKYFVKSKLKKITFKDMLYKHFYATPCVIVKRDVIIKVGMFNENQKYMEDSLLFTKIARDYNAYMSNEFLVNTYKNSFGESGLSANINEMQKFELENFKILYKENSKSNNKMTLIDFLCCNIFSNLKFIRRKILVYIRK